MNDIDEKYITEAITPNKKTNPNKWMKWVAMAACLCIVIGAVAVNRINTPSNVTTPNVGEESSPASGTITLYNNARYIALVTPDTLLAAGLPEKITEDVIGEHLAYLKLDGDVADYVETNETTDIELYECLVETPEEILILRDGDNCWPVQKLDSTENDAADQPVQNEVPITPTDDYWGGSYLDGSGNWVVWLTENTPDNQKLVLDQNPDLAEGKVIFKAAEYPLSYLNDLMTDLSDNMASGQLPFVSSAMVSEQTNRIEVYVTTDDEASIEKVLSFDTRGGAITIKYSDGEGTEDLGILE